MMTQYSISAICAIVAATALPATSAQARRPPTRTYTPHHAQMRPVAPARVQVAWGGESGTASWYGPRYNGRRAADGSRFDQNAMTAAHPWLPFGTRVRVTLADSSRSIIVVITDRLPPGRRIVDLSKAAAAELGIIQRGIAPVALTPPS